MWERNTLLITYLDNTLNIMRLGRVVLTYALPIIKPLSTDVTEWMGLEFVQRNA